MRVLQSWRLTPMTTVSHPLDSVTAHFVDLSTPDFSVCHLFKCQPCPVTMQGVAIACVLNERTRRLGVVSVLPCALPSAQRSEANGRVAALNRRFVVGSAKVANCCGFSSPNVFPRPFSGSGDRRKPLHSAGALCFLVTSPRVKCRLITTLWNVLPLLLSA